MKPSTTFCRDTIELVKTISQSFLILGERLHKIFTEKLWEGQYESFDEFVEETKISRGQISKLIAVYETWVLECGIDEAKLAVIPWSSLYEMRKLLLPDKSNAKEVIQETNALTRKHIEDKVREAEHPNCKHLTTYKLEICPHCGERWKIE